MGSQYASFSERQIGTTIRNKAHPYIVKRRNTHDIGFIYVDDVLVTKVKIPNGHNKEVSVGLTDDIAKSLRLNRDQYNRFMRCPMKGSEYLDHLRQFK
jgi:hypothetical protein